MEHLSELSKEYGYPSADKLYDAAIRAGFQVTHKQVRAFVASQNVRQVFHKLPRGPGKITAPMLDDSWVADLIDYTGHPSVDDKPSPEDAKKPPFQYILVVQDVFSRRLMARALRDKQPETCKNAFQSIIEERGTKPNSLSTDLGPEFKGPFDAYLTQEHIYHQLKDPRNLNAQGTLDAAIRTLRPMLSRIMAQESTRNWAHEVPGAVLAYNKLAHSHLHGRTPDEVEGDGNLRFSLEKEAAQDFQQNENVVAKRDAKIQAAGYFRNELQPRKFKKGYQANYTDEVHQVQSVENSRIVDTHGNEFSSRHVLPVPAGSSHISTEGLKGGSAPIDDKRKAALEPFKQQIVDYVGAAGKWLHEVAQKMKDLGMAPLIAKGLNYRTALLLLGLEVAKNGRVTLHAAPACCTSCASATCSASYTSPASGCFSCSCEAHRRQTPPRSSHLSIPQSDRLQHGRSFSMLRPKEARPPVDIDIVPPLRSVRPLQCMVQVTDRQYVCTRFFSITRQEFSRRAHPANRNAIGLCYAAFISMPSTLPCGIRCTRVARMRKRPREAQVLDGSCSIAPKSDLDKAANTEVAGEHVQSD